MSGNPGPGGQLDREGGQSSGICQGTARQGHFWPGVCPRPSPSPSPKRLLASSFSWCPSVTETGPALPGCGHRLAERRARGLQPVSAQGSRGHFRAWASAPSGQPGS